MLVLRAGIGRARPHSRRAVARRLDLRVRRVRRLERRGLHTARALARQGACTGGSSGGGATSGTALASGGGGALIPPPPVPERVGGGAQANGGGGSSSGDGSGSSSGDSSGSSSGDVLGESQTQLPPPIDTGPGHRVDPGGLSLGIGIGLILLALLAGYATPHLRARLRSGRPA